jgi:hypothetical protein
MERGMTMISTRLRPRILGSAVLGAMALGQRAPASAQEASPVPGTPEPFHGDALLGWLLYGTAVAIVSTGSHARGYLCDGQKVNVWLEGTASGAPGLGGADLELRAEDGTRLTGVIRGSWERGGWLEDGIVTWPDGRSEPVTAEDPESVPPAGSSTDGYPWIAGLYDVVVAEDGSVTGTSHWMLPLSGHTAMVLPDGSVLLAVLAEPLDGPTRAFATVATPDAGGAMRWIVQADGTTVGGGVPGWGSGFVRTLTDVDLPDSRDAP